MPCHGKSTVTVDNMPRHGDVTMPRHGNVTVNDADTGTMPRHSDVTVTVGVTMPRHGDVNVDDTAAKILSNSAAVSPQQSTAAKRVSEAGGPKINIGD